MKRYLITALLVLSVNSGLNAQTNTFTDSVEVAFLPAVSYNSDFGLLGGGIFNRYAYRDLTYPFYSFMNISGILSTKGLASFRFEYEKPKVFGTDLRLDTEFFVFRFFEDNYFGIGNYRDLTEPPDNKPGYYLFKTFGIGISTDLRYPVLRSGTSNGLDIIATLDLDYETPWDNGSDRLITEPNEQPLGYTGGTTLLFGTGLIWEGRNSEFRPTSGSFAKAKLKFGNSVWGSSFTMFSSTLEASSYVSFFLIREITFANRISFHHTAGEVPYWKLAYAGDELSIRGYPARRFLDDNAVYLNSELRTWLFEIPSIDSRIGGNLFFDMGRTFANDTPLNVWIQDLKYSFGFSGTASLFTPDFIIRGDVGFSKEDIGIYITTGYMF